MTSTAEATKADPTAILNKKGIPYTEIKDYLDGLRQRGCTNMYGGAAYIRANFSISAAEARAELTRWMDLTRVGA